MYPTSGEGEVRHCRKTVKFDLVDSKIWLKVPENGKIQMKISKTFNNHLNTMLTVAI